MDFTEAMLERAGMINEIALPPGCVAGERKDRPVSPWDVMNNKQVTRDTKRAVMPWELLNGGNNVNKSK